MSRENFRTGVRQKSIFPPSLFFVYLGVLLLMSGIHTGLIVGMSSLDWPEWARIYIPPLYWGVIAFAGWAAPSFVYRKIKHTKTQQMEPFIEAKREEIYTLFEKGRSLL